MLIAPILAAAMMGAAVPAPSQAGHPLTGLLQEACLATDMRRAAFERLATERGWEPLLLMVRSQADIDRHNALPDWDRGYDVPGIGHVFMAGPKTHRPAVTRCFVEAEAPQGDWRAAVDQFAASLDMTPRQGSVRDGEDVKKWSGAGGRSLTAAYDPNGRALTVTVSQPLAPAS